MTTHDANDDWDSDVDTAINLNKRLPAVLLLDTSGSMSGSKINALNEGLRVLQEEFDPATGDPTAIRSVEFAMVTFGAGGVQLVDLRTGQGAPSAKNAFVEAMDFRAPVLSPGGGTPMGQGMTMALSALEERKRFYKEQSIPYFCPWIFLISDGAPDGGWESAAAAALAAQQGQHVIVFPIGVEGANLNLLGKFSTMAALPLQGLKFRELFQFISSSMTKVSQSAPGTTSIPITPGDLATWSQINLSHG